MVEKEANVLIDHLDVLAEEYNQRTTKNFKKEKGQFFTPSVVAEFMAGLVTTNKSHVSILDPGAGIGILSTAVIEKLLKNSNLKEIDLITYETDREVIPYLKKALFFIKKEVDLHNVVFNYEIIEEDFVMIVPKSKTPYTSTYYTDTGLTTDTTYYYKIRAYQMIGGVKTYCNFSEIVSARPVLKAVSGAKASRSSSTKIKLTWSSVSGATGYEIQRCITGVEADFATIYTTIGTGRTYYNGSLTKGTKYYYRIRAYRTVAGDTYYGGWSKTISATP